MFKTIVTFTMVNNNADNQIKSITNEEVSAEDSLSTLPALLTAAASQVTDDLSGTYESAFATRLTSLHALFTAEVTNAKYSKWELTRRISYASALLTTKVVLATISLERF